MKARIKNRVLLDTNIIIRALIDQNRLLSTTLETENEIHIPLPIFFETMFVLEKIYKLSRTVISDYIFTIISYENTVTELEILKGTLINYINKPKLSVIDSFLLAYANKNRLDIKTLDRMLLKAI